MKPAEKPKIQAPAWLMAAALVAVMGTAVPAQNAPAGPAIDDAEDVEQTPKMSFLELLGKGRWFMLPIGACSLLGLALIIERLLALRRRSTVPRNFMTQLTSVYKHPVDDRDLALEYCQSIGSPIARVVAAGIRKLPQGIAAAEHGMEDSGANEIAKMRRNLRMLYGISNVSPMLGLLGTVWGMIEAFQVAAVQGLGQAERLAGGIYAALVTTFAGLCVAIPLLIFYYYFTGKIEGIAGEMNDVCEEFVERYGVDPASPAGV